MDLDLRSRVRAAGENWGEAPKELIKLKELLQSIGREVSWNPRELADIMLKQGEARVHFLKEVLMEFYDIEDFWSAESIDGLLHKSFIACKDLGMEVTTRAIEGKGTMEENFEFWDKVLHIQLRISTKVKPKGFGQENVKVPDRGRALSQQVSDHQIIPLDQSDSEEHTISGKKLSGKESSMTTSFTELPDIHGDHVDVDQDGNYIKPIKPEDKRHNSIKHEEKRLNSIKHEEHLHSGKKSEVLVLQGKRFTDAATRTPSPQSTDRASTGGVLARYDKNHSSDETTQAGISSWDWLARLEQLLIHFFLIIFDSSADSTKLMMELMPTEATRQIEEIFKLLLQAEPEMYDNLGHIVSLAEKWLVHWGGNGAKKSKALEFVRLYMLGMKNKNYYNLPVQVRLQQLGAFIAELKKIEDEDKQLNDLAIAKPLPQNIIPVKTVSHSRRRRSPSPRVKPAAHFARVVASILCDRPCGRPFPPPTVYADDFTEKVFKTPFHNDQGFQKYIDKKYGAKYVKNDIFLKELGQSKLKSLEPPKPKLFGIENKDCWLPIYTEAYLKKIKDGKCCKNYKEDPPNFTYSTTSYRKGKRRYDYDGERRVRTPTSGRNPYRSGQNITSSESKWTIGPDGKRKRRKRHENRSTKELFTRRPTSVKSIKRGRSRKNLVGYNSDEEWEHDKNGKRIARKPGKYPQPGDPDYNSDDDWFHDKFGKRVRRKHPLGEGRRSIPGDPDYNTDTEWEHDKNGKRIKRRQPLSGGQRPQPGDLDYVSDDEWEHDKFGNRIKRRDYPKPATSNNVPKKPDEFTEKNLQKKAKKNDSDEWEHDKFGMRIIKKVQPGEGENPEMNKNNSGRNNIPAPVEKKKSEPHAHHHHPGRKSKSSEVVPNDDKRQSKRKSVGNNDGRQSKADEGNNLPMETQTRYHGGTSKRPSWITGHDQKGGIKMKGLLQSQADMDERLRQLRLQHGTEDVQLPAEDDDLLSKINKPIIPALSMRSSLLHHDEEEEMIRTINSFELVSGDYNFNNAIKKIKRIDAVSLKDRLKKLDALYRGEQLGEDGLDDELQDLLNRKNNMACDAKYMDDKNKGNNKIGCPASLWGALPIPTGQPLLSQVGGPPIPIQSKNVLHEDTTGGLGDYSSIPANVNKFKQIFRDEARAKGLPRPNTAEVTSRMIVRTAKLAKKRLEDEAAEAEFSQYDPMRRMKRHGEMARKKKTMGGTVSMMDAKNTSKHKKKNHIHIEPDMRTKVPLAKSLFELMKKSNNDMTGNESETALDENGQLINPQSKRKTPPRNLRPGVMDDIARRFHGVMSGPFIAHIDRSQKNRLSFSLADTPITGKRRSIKPQPLVNRFSMKRDSQTGIGEDEGESSFDIYDEEEEEDGLKLPSLAVREKITSNQTINSKEDPIKLPAINNNNYNQDDPGGFADKLLFPTNSNRTGNFDSNNRRKKHLKQDGNRRQSLARKLSHLGSDGFIPHNGQGDQINVNMVNPCWEMTSKLFKTPLRAPAIPLPENLVVHIEKKFPKLQWPRGVPVALRYYPSGQPFCVVFQNGAGRVHYPHGGLAVAISAPAPHYSRILVIRDPFDQFYFFDKAVLADLNCNGKGAIYDDDGIIKLQYNLQGGFRQEGLDKPSQRWQWNQGGQRLIIKLNRYMALRILDLNKIYLVFYGNKRGFRLNVGAGRRVNLMSVTCDSNKSMPSYDRPSTACGGYDYITGRFSTPVLGFFDNQKTNGPTERCKTANYYPPAEATYRYSFSNCNINDLRENCCNPNFYRQQCQEEYL